LGFLAALGLIFLGIDNTTPTISTTGIAVLLTALGTYGAVVMGTVLTQRHTGFDPGNPYLWAARRFLPWVAVWIMVALASLAGFVLLIVPGIIIGLRLIWADEFVLTQSSSPLAALRESWNATRGRVSTVFTFQFLLGLAQYVILIPGLLVLLAFLSGINALGLPGSVQQLVSATFLFTMLLVGYGSFHAAEIVYFYAIRAGQAPQKSRVGVAVLTVFGIFTFILIVAAIAIPSLLRSRQAANEYSAIATLRMLHTAEATFQNSTQRYATLEELIDAGLVDQRFGAAVAGYRFSIVPEDQEYTIVATRISENNGRWEFVIQSDGIVRYSASETLAPPSQAGLPVK